METMEGAGLAGLLPYDLALMEEKEQYWIIYLQREGECVTRQPSLIPRCLKGERTSGHYRQDSVPQLPILQSDWLCQYSSSVHENLAQTFFPLQTSGQETTDNYLEHPPQ